MRILIFSAYYLPGYKGGGPIKTIKNLCEQVGKEKKVKIITNDHDLGESSPYMTVRCGDWNKVGNAYVFYSQPGIKGLSQMVKILYKKRYDLVYLNSFFSIRFSVIPLILAKLLHQKIILAPRGEFSEGALALKSVKKWLFILTFKTLGLHRGIVYQVSSDYEAVDIRRVLGDNADIRVAENIGSRDFVESIPPRSSNTLHAVFVSRISPKKNLLMALEVLRTVRNPVQYHIYGPIEDRNYWSSCEAAIASLPPNVQVLYEGAISPDKVVQTISAYDVFFMPTKGENYGHVIVEALCAGLPILIADTTPWRNLQEQGIGWDLPLTDSAEFSRIIDELAAIPIEKHRRMRETVLAWAKNKFSQRDAIDANVDLFTYAYEKSKENLT